MGQIRMVSFCVRVLKHPISEGLFLCSSQMGFEVGFDRDRALCVIVLMHAAADSLSYFPPGLFVTGAAFVRNCAPEILATRITPSAAGRTQ